jgi:hypothetical protein
MEPIKFISPSNFYYWEKCPLKAVFSRNFKAINIPPSNQNGDLGTIIHKFLEKANEWQISDEKSFENKWIELINEMENIYRGNTIQTNYLPVSWYCNYYAVKKICLKSTILNKKYSIHLVDIDKIEKHEKWISDEKYVGGIADYLRYDSEGNIEEIVDFKTGGIYDIIEKKLKIKEEYQQQLSLYAKLVFIKQNFIPKTYIQDIKGIKHNIELSEDYINDIYERAILLWTKINDEIKKDTVSNLACVNESNCKNCDYRPHCDRYKEVYMNKIDISNVDITGIVQSISNFNEKFRLEIKIENQSVKVIGDRIINEISEGQVVSIYNLFNSNTNSQIVKLFFTKRSIVVYE